MLRRSDEWVDGRSPPQVVAESCQPSGALMQFVASALENGGFDIETAGWPQLAVIVDGTRHMLTVGGIERGDAKRARERLRECLEILER